MKRFAVALAFSALFAAASAVAEVPVRSQLLNTSDLFQVKSNGVTVTCGRVSGRWISGSLVNGRFLSFAQAIRNKRALLKGATSKQRLKLQTTIAHYRQLQTQRDPICHSGPPKKPGETASPSPSGTPAPTGNFDSAGNVTAKGKTAFGIPSNLSANITTGHSLHSSYACTSCHNERIGRSFTQVKQAIATVSAMDFIGDTASDGDIANIVAYLNRFNMN